MGRFDSTVRMLHLFKRGILIRFDVRILVSAAREQMCDKDMRLVCYVG